MKTNYNGMLLLMLTLLMKIHANFQFLNCNTKKSDGNLHRNFFPDIED